MSDPPTTASLATTIGRYHVVQLIAHGGMGSLYLARDPTIDRLIAIKLLQERFDDEAARERFAREARATGGLRHPNIVTVFDVGEHDKRPFIAMEYVPGETLAQLLRRRAPLSINERLAILEDLCAGLHFAHSAGIVHRDIKPANVMLDVSGTLKILDFGLARASDSGITKSGDQLGTLNYMSPEQVVGGHLDHRSDVYAVGAVAYELMSRRKAFQAQFKTA
jgi:serine/threonine protein kinase